MSKRIQTWLQETHGGRFELVRHFLSRFFDSEMVAIPGEWQKVAIGVLAVMLCYQVMA